MTRSDEDTCAERLESGSCSLLEPSVCFVVRTYWGHGDEHGGELRSFLGSLQHQDNPKYVYLVI